MTPKLALFLREYWEEREWFYQQLGKQPTLDDLVFASSEGKPLDPSMLSHDFATIAKQVGLSGVRFHDLRHTYASHLAMRGVDIRKIQELLGHRDITMTVRYSHLSNADLREAVKRLDVGTNLAQESSTKTRGLAKH